jgi:hypothetical protein
VVWTGHVHVKEDEFYTERQFHVVCGSSKTTSGTCFMVSTYKSTILKRIRIKLHSLKSNRVLRRVSGLKRDEVTEEWRRLLNKELHILKSSPNIIRVMKSRRLRWAGQVVRIGERKGQQGFSGKT